MNQCAIDENCLKPSHGLTLCKIHCLYL
ncbi:hypothetical protein D915_011124 [Fasciola hepatica]|uniref:Uncharacterized protein n=1 Tax=Fasciola hepatica TaxID=6192 RepID=A0A4E0QYP3_FASHE|nr:hypothetical protein D915_011124 [Fasciola hepatica]